MKVRILKDDIRGRWYKGELGEMLPNDSNKYDYLLQLSGNVDISLFGKQLKAKRLYYFYKNEVELLED